MSEGKHTPGSWAVNEDGFKVESENDHGWANDGWVICVTEGPDKEGNARLIAAAPDMLEALKAFEAHYPMGVNPFLDDAFRSARAAISKAKGINPKVEDKPDSV